MSDTTNLADEGNEPSMEDILSSIRQVIAEDKSSETDETDETDNDQLEMSQNELAENTDSPENMGDNADNINQSSHGDGTAELEAIRAYHKNGELPDNNVDIADASNNADEPASIDDIDDLSLDDELLLDEVFDNDDKVGKILPPIAPSNNPESQSDEDILELADLEIEDDDLELEAIEIDDLEIDISDDEKMEADYFEDSLELVLDNDAKDYASATAFEDIKESKTEIENDSEPELAENSETKNNENEEELDLVKSLLADLMEEPGAETTDEILQDDLELDIEEELQDNELDDIEDNLEVESASGAIIDGTDENITENADSENGESELEKIAREVNEQILELEDLPDEEIELDSEEIMARLALVGTNVAQAGAANLEKSMSKEEMSQEEAAKEEVIIEKIIDNEKPDIENKLTDSEELKEETEMPKAVKEETLLNETEAEEAKTAFASLSEAVQEKALAEENGPPIGELVKEALRPMLQEWLDKNLKGMVQRAITKEIKRISSGK